MRSARRRKQIEGKVRRKSFLFVAKILAIPLILLLVFVFFKVTTRYWNGKDKVGFVYLKTNGDVGVTVLDPRLSELTTLVIPADTEVDVARNYGTLRIKNVWQLSQNEKLKGKLLPETVTQNFLFPVFLWSEKDLSDALDFIFKSGSTNIPFGDRVSMAYFALNVPSLGRTEINLGESQFLSKSVLSDGLAGYKLKGKPSQRLTVYFSDDGLSNTVTKINIVDSTGSPGVAEKVGEILEVLGGKVVAIEKRNPEASGCQIVGSNKDIVKMISLVFNCQIGQGVTNFDLEVKLGADFAKRF